MSSGIDNAAANNFITATIKGGSWTAYTTPFLLKLMTANGSDASAGTELSGYTPPSLAGAFGSVSGGAVTSTSPVSITSMPAGTIIGVEIWDSTTPTAKRITWGSITSKTTNAGDTLTFSSGNISFAVT